MTRVFRLVSRFLPVPLLLFSLSVSLTASLHFALFSINHSRFSSHLDVRFSAFPSLLLSCFFFFPPHVSSVLQHNELQHLQVCSQHLKILNELIERSLSLSHSLSSSFPSFLFVLLFLTSQRPAAGSTGFFFFFLCVGISAPWELIR